MRRTQIYLPEDQWKELHTLSQRQSTPVAALIRRALAQVYPVRHHSRFEHALDGVIGMWRDRSDLGTTESYVRALRQDDRLDRLAL